MQLLVHHADLSIVGLGKSADEPPPSAPPDEKLQEGKPQKRQKSAKTQKLDLAHWPGDADVQSKEVRRKGITACARLIADRAKITEPLRRLLSNAGLDSNDEETAEALYRYVFESSLDYWALAHQLGTDRLTREWLAMEGGVCRYFVWPRRKTQFFYATHLPRAINASEVPDCQAILGSFTVTAEPNQPACIVDASAYYLIGSGELRTRGMWKSQAIGIDEERLTIVYDLQQPNRQPYTGLISIKRDRARPPAIQNPPIENDRYRGTRCFIGEIYTLNDADFRYGRFVAEEVEAIHQSYPDEEALLRDVKLQAEFLKRLGLARNCAYCSNKQGLCSDMCAFIGASGPLQQ